jgi:MOSC domain-containing protein YiiM
MATAVPPPTKVRAVLLGRAVPYTRPGTRSGIDKQPVDGPVRVTRNGLAGDEQGDPRVHGGPDKAVHHYAYEHYPAWRRELPPRQVLDQPGAFGENLSTIGWTEQDVCLADVVRVGTAVLEVSQARQPCWKLNDRFAEPSMARQVQSTGRTGWYYRVLAEGELRRGDSMAIVERPWPDWPLGRLLGLLFDRVLDPALLEEAAALPLPPSWLKLLQRRIETATVEHWGKRLEGPPVDGAAP